MGGPQDAKWQIFMNNFNFTDFGRNLEKKILECPKKRWNLREVSSKKRWGFRGPCLTGWKCCRFSVLGWVERLLTHCRYGDVYVMTSDGFLVIWDWEGVCLSLFTRIYCKKSQKRGGLRLYRRVGSLNMRGQVRVCEDCEFGYIPASAKILSRLNDKFAVLNFCWIYVPFWWRIES